jgi:4-carboxymuconolactone decarboxylase
MKQGDPTERRATGVKLMNEIVDRQPPANPTLLEETIRDFSFAEIWSRPGLDRRSRRWIALSACAATGMAEPLEEYVHGALKSGDITLAELREGVLHFAIYSGWPLARQYDKIVTRVADKLGLSAQVPALRDQPWDPKERWEYGAASFHKVMTFPSPPAPSSYVDGGIKNFVFGEMWMRPGLDQRARRWITLACVGASDTQFPIITHVYAALNAGDATYAEMEEFVLQFAYELGWPKGSVMQTALENMGPKVEKGEFWM